MKPVSLYVTHLYPASPPESRLDPESIDTLCEATKYYGLTGDDIHLQTLQARSRDTRYNLRLHESHDTLPRPTGSCMYIGSEACCWVSYEGASVRMVAWVLGCLDSHRPFQVTWPPSSPPHGLGMTQKIPTPILIPFVVMDTSSVPLGGLSMILRVFLCPVNWIG